jgi:hypothetical protein
MSKEDQFWGSGGEGKKDSGQNPGKGEGEFWGKASAKVEAEQHAKTRAAVDGGKPATPPSGKSGTGRKLVLGGLVAIVLVLMLVVGFLPTIASALAPGIIESQASAQINGTVKVTDVSLSWAGPQNIGQVQVRDKDGNDVATMKAVASLGIIDLLGGIGDLGEIKLSGKANLTRHADGSTTLDQLMVKHPAAAAAPGATGGSKTASQPTTLPKNLKVRVKIDGFDLGVRDEMLGAQTNGAVSGFEIKGLAAEALVQVGGTSQVELKAQANTLGAGGSSVPGGALVIQGKVTGWSDAAGLLTLDRASVDANVQATDLSMSVVDAIAGLGGKLTSAVGEKLNATIVAQGGLTGGNVDIKASGANLSIAGNATVKDNLLTTPTPITIKASGKGLEAFRGDLEKAVGKDMLTVAAMPDVEIAVRDVKIKLPANGGALDLRGSSLAATVQTGELRGTMKLDPNGAAQALELKPFRAEVAAPDLGGTVRLTAGTAASIGGQPAGSFDINVTAAGLLDKNGAPTPGMPGSLNGVVALKGVRTAIAQPFAAASGLDLPTDIGPTIDAEISAQTAAGDGASLPPTTIQIKAVAQSLDVGGSVQVSATSIRTVGDGISLRVRQAGAIATKLAPKDSGLSIVAGPGGGTGDLTAKVAGLSVPLDASRKPIAGKAEGKVEVAMGSASMRLLDKGTGQTNAIDLTSFGFTASARPGASPRVELNSVMGYSGQPFTIAGGFDLAGLFATDGVTLTPDRIRPLGRLDIKGLPTALAQIAGGKAEPGKPSLDLPALLRDVVGPTADIMVSTQPTKQLENGLDVTGTMRSNGVSADLAGAFSDTELAIKTAQVEATMSPKSADSLIRTFAPDVANGKAGLGSPRLGGPARAVVSIGAFKVPMKNSAPDLSTLDSFDVTATLPGNVVVEGLALAGKPDARGVAGPATVLGPVGIADLKLTTKVPASVASGQSTAAKPMRVDVTARLMGAGPGAPASGVQKLADMSAGVSTNLLGTAPSGATAAGLKFRDVNSAALDRFMAPLLGLAQNDVGMASGVLGERANLSVDVALDAPTTKQPAWTPTFAALEIEAPRVKTTKPIKLSTKNEVLALAEATELSIDADPQWLTAMLGKPNASGARQLTVEKIGKISVNLQQLAIATPKDPTMGPMKPGVFKLGAAFAARSADLKLEDGKRVRIEDLSADVRSADNNAIDFVLSIGSTQLTDATGAQPAAKESQIKATVRNLADAKGNVQAEKAEITAQGKVPALPTALVDALANQGGMIAAALGPTVALDIRADKFTLDPAKPGGSLRASAVASRADASLSGRIDGKVFAFDGPLNAKVTEITKDLSDKLIKGVPVVESIIKSRDLQPATVVGEGLRVPLDNQMSNLNGKVTLDPGELKITSGGTFARFLKLAKVDPSTQIGKKLDPLVVNFQGGVATYERYTLPVGEFKFESEGKIDLVSNTIDAYTYVPFAALTDEAGSAFTGAINKIPGLGETIQALTLMPFHTTGSLNSPQTKPDVEKFAKEFIKKLNPDDLIKKGVDLFKDKIKLPGSGGGGGVK